jgi:chemotaxis protein histidine kinase CheA
MQELFERLTAWGCDVEGARERFLMDDELYVDCLKIFEGDECFRSLPRSLEKGDYAAAFDQAHTLKGVSANLGLTPLTAALSRLVEDLRAKRCAGTAEQCRAVLVERQRLSDLLKSV